MNVQPEKVLYSPTNFAHAADIAKSRVYELMEAGLLAYVRYGSDRRIPASELHRFAKEGIPALPKKGTV